MKYLLTLIYLVCTTGGLAFMKAGGDSLKLSFNDGFTFKIGLLTFIGFALYLVSFLLWQRMLIKYDLSVMVPIVTGMVQVIVLLMGLFLFHESVSIVSLVGAVIVITGIICVTLIIITALGNFKARRQK